MISQKEIVFYSCIIKNRDEPKPIKINDEFRYVLFTDNLNIQAPGWEILPPVWQSSDPVRTSRYHKLHAFDIFPDCEQAIWLDMTHSPYKSIKPLLNGSDLVVQKHPRRSTVKDEAIACCHLNKDVKSLIKSQFEHYKKEGFPDNLGLYHTSCLIMRNTCLFRKLSEMWWHEICCWSKRDQISFPYCLWKLDFKPDVIPGFNNKGINDYFKFHPHKK
jgi:hypothetical protein